MQSAESTTRTSEFWGICCEGGKKYSQVVKQKFHITMAALDPTVVPTSPVVSLMVDRGGCEYLLCSLKPSSVLQVNLNLYFDKGEKVTFSLRGQGKIHLSGYHIFGKNEQVEISEKGTIVSPAKSTTVIKSKLTSKESIVSQENTKSPKKKVQIATVTPVKTENSVKDKKAKMNVVDIEDSADSSDEDNVNQDSKAVSPKKNAPSRKKVAEDENDSDDEEESDDDLFDELDDSDEESEREKSAKKDAKKLQSYKRLWSEINEADEKDDDPESSDEDDIEEETPKSNKKKQDKKRLKNNSCTPASNEKSTKTTPEKAFKMDILENDKAASGKKTPKANNDLLNSSVGRTPMPQKKTPKFNQANALTNKLTPKKVTFTESENSSSDSDDEGAKTTAINTTPVKQTELNASLSASEKKKRKKKKKSLEALNTINSSDTGSNKTGKTGLSSASYSKKLEGGLEYEDIRVGNGPIAKSGKLVHVFYSGMLENNKVFDSRAPGTKPFSFKLGSGSVIKGWDVGIEGMKVGGKRRLKVPANLGYKNQKMGPIPPNSTLYFTVELRSVT